MRRVTVTLWVALVLALLAAAIVPAAAAAAAADDLQLAGAEFGEAESSMLAELSSEAEAAVEAEVDAELAAAAETEAELEAEAEVDDQVLLESEAEAGVEAEVEAEAENADAISAAVLHFSSDAPVDIHAHSSEEVSPVMRASPQDHMVMVPAAGSASGSALRARASAAAEEQEDRALLALEASVYANGCGSGWQSKVVPQWNMAPACNKHDNCYEDCKNSRARCDSTMLADMRAICKSKYAKVTQKITKTICEGQAVLYYQSVSRFGAAAYARGMAKAGCPNKKA